MSEKPMAGLLTAIAVARLCLVCALGSAAFVAAAGHFLAWFDESGLPLAAGVPAIGIWPAWWVFRRPPLAGEEEESDQPSMQGRSAERAH